MTFLCIIFVPPLYFVVRRKWGGFLVSSVLYGFACMCVLSMIGVMVAPLFWLVAVAHAAFYYKREAVERHAEMLASKMAEKMNETKQPKP